MKNFFIRSSSFFEMVDQFGVIYTPSVKGNEKEFKTCFGGITTLILYLLAIVYALYIFVQWNLGNQAVTSTSEQQALNYTAITFKQFPVTLQMLKTSPFSVEPFELTNNVLTPLYFKLINDQIEGPFTLFTDSNETISQSETKKLKGKKIELILNTIGNKSGTEPNTQYLLILVRCQQQLLPPSGTCASDEIINNFISIPFNRIDINIQLQSYNTNKKKLQQFSKNFYFLLDPFNLLYSQIVLTTANLRINSGKLFNDYEKFQYISNAQMITQTLSQNKSLQIFQYPAYFSTLFRIDSISEEINISYPQLGTILAEIGSIVSLLFTISIVVQIVNSTLLEVNLNKEIISFYFPEFRNLKVVKRFNKIIKVTDQENHSYDIEDYKRFYSQARLISEHKRNVLNQIYEISRIQMLLHSLLDRNYIYKAKQIGIKLKLKRIDDIQLSNQETGRSIELVEQFQKGTQPQNQEDFLLKERDFQLFCWGESLGEQTEVSNQFREINKEEFFEQNKIIIQ